MANTQHRRHGQRNVQVNVHERGRGAHGELLCERGTGTLAREVLGTPAIAMHLLLACVLAAAVAAVALCAIAPPAHAAVTLVQVDGKTIYSASKGAKQAVKGVSYDAKKNKLTLNKVKLTTKASDAVRIAAGAKDVVKVKLKGTNTISAAKAGIRGFKAGCSLAFSGSQLTVNGMSTAVTARNVTFNDGSFAFKRCSTTGVVGLDAVRIPADKVGTVSVTMLHPDKSAAIVATHGKVSNAPERLGTIAGRLGKGTTFEHANSQYKVIGSETVKLVRYSGGKEADTDSVVYAKSGYDIAEIATGAFDNRVGRKVTKIVLGSALRTIQHDAFKGTNLLTNLDARYFLNNVDIRDWRRVLNTLVKGVDSKAFRGCGMLSGAKLTVHTGFENADVNIAIKGAMTIKGMPLLARFRK